MCDPHLTNEETSPTRCHLPKVAELVSDGGRIWSRQFYPECEPLITKADPHVTGECLTMVIIGTINGTNRRPGRNRPLLALNGTTT